MSISIKSVKTGVFSFLIVLLLMPIGHALMVLNEKLIPDHKFIGAGIIGFIGLFLFFLGIRKNKKTTYCHHTWLNCRSTYLDRLGGVFVCMDCRKTASSSTY